MALSVEKLMDRYFYDPETGFFTHKKWHPGKLAGCRKSNGYITICVDTSAFYAHRLAWLYMHESFPVGDIDHINGVRHDNRIDNLRVATRSQNNQNKVLAREFQGVSGVAKSSSFRARIKLNGKEHYLGVFDTPEGAREAYLRAKINMHPFADRIAL